MTGTAGCSSAPYRPDLCKIVNLGVAQCNPTDPSRPKYDIDEVELIGYTCMSPEDLAEGRKLLRKLSEGLD